MWCKAAARVLRAVSRRCWLVRASIMPLVAARLRLSCCSTLVQLLCLAGPVGCCLVYVDTHVHATCVIWARFSSQQRVCVASGACCSDLCALC
jgi:hypothetical protein